ncbi:related to transcription initiation factor IIE chain TFA1 [Cephalotrichum gorgonifer]|uniref:Related to transcription initiation factor IIE chain TFA1 n=1 Tax=Cephalotrichum gorgonifer TaxID=2041049 RepID=A0AAE8MTH6_9PEZI|nr:related to transcription initiation factor IIE chain TFA1 [Cephalotrichum gorgonifer]
MDLAQTLLKMVTRAFYDTRQIIAVDAVMTHSCLRDDELAYLASLNTKDLHKLVAKLKEERLMHQFNRPEMREGQLRPVTRIYYYIDYRQAIDAIKWRVYNITKDIQGSTVPASEKKEYFCNRCQSEWTQMEVLDSFGPNGFVCHRCEGPLVHDLDRNSAGHEQSTRLNNQFKFVTDLLQQIDQVHVPDNTFEVAMSNARPVVRDATNPGVKSVPIDPATMRPTAVKGLTNVGPKSMAVNISSADGPSEAEKAAELARKEKIAAQNALPSWMTNSTITGESYSARELGSTDLGKKEELDFKDTTLTQQAAGESNHKDIDDLFARLKAEQEQKELEEEEYGTDDEEDEDDEDNFEDVVPVTGVNSSVGTPSGMGAGAGQTPASGNGDVDGERPAKKVKVASPVPPEEEEESDEDVEFEDA